VRIDRNLTQLDVCRRSGLDVATYSRIEQGHASPLFDTLVRIADAIGVGEVDLMPDPAAGPGETPTAGR
jgi:transcriptional regulator with XRE-family HTH domain